MAAIPIPQTILDFHPNITLGVDYFLYKVFHSLVLSLESINSAPWKKQTT
jgi:hypothetical protein